MAQEVKTRTATAAEHGVTDEASRGDRIWTNVKTIGGAILLALLIRTVLFEAFEIEGPSMEPTLLNGDRVVVAKFLYGLFLPLSSQSAVNWSVPALGDVVIIKSPADNVDIVKRIIALSGDRIEIVNGVIYRNDIPMATSEAGPCVNGRGRRNPNCRVLQTRLGDKTFRISGAPMWQNRESITIPEGYVYVLGDHRDSSNDSRTIGPIPLRRLKGKALAIYWSTGEEGFRWDRMFALVR